MVTTVVRTAAKLLFVPMLVYGMYIVANGHITPGGGFQGGVVAGSGFIMLLVALDYKSFSHFFTDFRFAMTESTGSIVYVGVAFLGLIFGTVFFKNWLPLGAVGSLFSAGFMPPLNFAIGMKVAAGVGTIALFYFALFEMGNEAEAKEGKKETKVDGGRK